MKIFSQNSEKIRSISASPRSIGFTFLLFLGLFIQSCQKTDDVAISNSNEKLNSLRTMSKEEVGKDLANDSDFIEYFNAQEERNKKQKENKKKKRKNSENYVIEDYDDFLKKFNNNGILEVSEIKAIEEFSDVTETDNYKAKKDKALKKLLKKYDKFLTDSAVVNRAFKQLVEKAAPFENKNSARMSNTCNNPACDQIFTGYGTMADQERLMVEFIIKSSFYLVGIEEAITKASRYVSSKLTNSAGIAFGAALYAYSNKVIGFDPIDSALNKIANYAGDMQFVSTVSQGQNAMCACYRRVGCMCDYVSPAWWYAGGKMGLPMPMY